jgi:hypothetical protein
MRSFLLDIERFETCTNRNIFTCPIVLDIYIVNSIVINDLMTAVENIMTRRKAIPKKLRFEVFKRDSFTCQYCGHKSPDVLLVIDHIEPISKGGTNSILNLITSCQACNAGKSDRQLTDTSILDKQRRQLEDLQERKEQIEMMFQWQKSLLNLDDQLTNQLAEFWSELVPGFALNERGIKILKSHKRKFGLEEVMTSMKIAVDQYIEYIEEEPTKQSVEVAWNKVGGICTNRKRARENPIEHRLYYIRGILNNRLNYVDNGLALRLLHDALDANISIEKLEQHAKTSTNWSGWRADIEDLIERQNLHNKKSSKEDN